METLKQKILDSIKFLENNGYVVYPDYKSLYGKWCAFKQVGMEPILHGKIMDVSINGLCRIRCKNAEFRFIHIESIIGFYDSKKECYAVR